MYMFWHEFNETWSFDSSVDNNVTILQDHTRSIYNCELCGLAYLVIFTTEV
jgi:hypothetical protein